MMKLMHENAAPFLLEGGSHAVLMTHGFTGTCAHMLPLARRLNAAGFTVQGILLPGHGTSIADMRSTDWLSWLQAELAAATALKERYAHVSLCGLSMGGDLALIAAAKLGATACIPISAPMKVKNPFMPLARYVAPFLQELRWGDGSAVREERLMRAFNVGYSGFPTAKLADLQILMRMARKALPGITCPLLAVQSHDDTTISEDSAPIILEKVTSAVREVLWLKGVPHVCTISAEIEHIADTVAEFLRRAEQPATRNNG